MILFFRKTFILVHLLLEVYHPVVNKNIKHNGKSETDMCMYYKYVKT